MTLKAKPVLDNKFWIIEDEGVRVGTLSKDDNSFVFNKSGTVSYYADEKDLKEYFGANFLTAKVIPNVTKEQKNYDVHGFPTRTVPYNSMFDIKRKLPLFTKSEKSKSIYCAGYYLIKFNVNWLKSFCPKLITVERNEYMGPYKTELEMKVALSNVNK